MSHLFYRSIYFCVWAVLFAQIYSVKLEFEWLLTTAFMAFAFFSSMLTKAYMSHYNAKAFALWVFNPLVYIALFVNEHFKQGELLYNHAWPLVWIVMLLLFCIFIHTFDKGD